MADDTQQPEDFDSSPRAQAERWRLELAEARKQLESWHKQGAKVVQRFLDERKGEAANRVRWNLFTAAVETKMAVLYGQTPRVSVSRRYADAQDDDARVAGEMLERLLNDDIEKDSDTYAQALRYALEDRLLPGLGQVRVRYEAEFEAGEGTPAKVDEVTGQELAPAVPAVDRKVRECVATDYVHWRDYLWSPARVRHEVRWEAYRAEMSRAEAEKRFGKEKAAALPYGTRGQGKKAGDDDKKPSPWGRTEVWEVWDKETRRVYWVSEAHPDLLDVKDDPYGLEGFFPTPAPLVALATTTRLVPRPEFIVAQDLYDEVDRLSQRIDLLTQAVRVAGAYDKAAGASLTSILTGDDNKLVPVDNWALFAEKGGIKGVIDWLPLEQVVGAINILSERRMVAKDALYEVTGMADIMRGQGGAAGTSATEQAIKAKFGSVRLQRLQDEFARFASDVQRLKAELVAKHFEPATILECSNVLRTPDAPYAEKAVALLKDEHSAYRIEVKPESVALQDFAQLKGEAMEVLGSLATFLQAAAPLAQAVPGSMPYLLQMMQWALSRVRGANSIESVLDQAIEAAQKAPPPGAGAQGPTPEQMKLQAVQMKGQLDLAREDKKLQNDLVRIRAEQQANALQEQVQREQNVAEAAQKHAITALGRAQQPGPRGPAGGGL